MLPGKLRGCVSFLLALASLSAFPQTTITLVPSKDNSIFSQPANNSNGQGPYFLTGVTAAGALRRALIRFDLSTIPTGSVITAATLNLSMVRTLGGSVSVNLHRLSEDWGEGASTSGSGDIGVGAGVSALANDATWVNRFHSATPWSTAGGSFVGTVSAVTNVSGNGPYSWSGTQMIADLQAWVANPATNFGWLIRTSEEGAGNVKEFGSRNNVTASLRPSLSITYTAGNLPVMLSSWKATEVEHGVLLNWQTRSEVNNAFYVVTHSLNGITFSGVGKVNGSGTSNSVKDYSFLHMGLSQGSHYYQLLQTDFDGRVHLSSIVKVAIKDSHREVKISPNPVRDRLMVNGFAPGTGVLYSIANASGAVVLSGKLIDQQIQISGLPSGHYTISLRAGKVTYSGRFLKK